MHGFGLRLNLCNLLQIFFHNKISNCFNNFYDFGLVKECCKCKSIGLKSNFYKNRNKKDGLNFFCKKCTNNYVEDYIENRIKTDVYFRSNHNARCRIHHLLIGGSKLSSTINLSGIHIDTYKEWIEYKITPEMNWLTIEKDHMKPIFLFNKSIDEGLRETFHLKKTKVFSKKDQYRRESIFGFWKLMIFWAK